MISFLFIRYIYISIRRRETQWSLPDYHDWRTHNTVDRIIDTFIVGACILLFFFVFLKVPSSLNGKMINGRSLKNKIICRKYRWRTITSLEMYKMYFESKTIITARRPCRIHGTALIYLILLTRLVVWLL